jgi:hypothetical protein
MTSEDPKQGLTRRDALVGATALAAAVATGGPGAQPAAGAARAAASPGRWRHGGALAQRGVDVAAAAGREREGRFGLMFKKLGGFAPPDDALADLAARMTDPDPGGPPRPDDPLANPAIPAGFTFFGQFLDHDMTFDQTPLPQQQVDPRGLVNFDSPRLDLASVYGRGPQSSPELYDPAAPGKLLLVRPHGIDDLPRRPDGSALIGDPRNDENLIVVQLHIAFVKLHNRLVDAGLRFADAQRLTRWHFQWVVVHDFLEHVVGRATVERFLRTRGGRIVCRREHYKPKNPNRPMMPVEYAVAAYRFGHSMVRAGYLLNATAFGPMFTNPPSEGDMHGSRPLPPRMRIDWAEFFAVDPGRAPHNMARRIDTKLSLPLHDLPPSVVPPDIAPVITDLARRNLLRGKAVGLPAGQDVARAMGATPLGNAALGLEGAAWGGKAPLWFYVLAEAEVQQQGLRLGEVGGRIVAETILGILDADKGSYFHQPGWAPTIPPGGAGVRIGDLLRFAEG